MSDLYPLLLKPEFHPRVWGARDLSPIYLEPPGPEPIGEAWLTADSCKVTNGPLAGVTLGDLCRRYGRDLVGVTARETDRFPLLIKFLFPREKLSVQVHPDDDGARALGQPCGKTECWYVVSADPGAQVGVGLKPGVSKGDFEQAIREVRAEQLLNWIDIHPGELVYVDAGTVHAIGPGSILVETQQNSDTTFRLYDYGRPRELHVAQGLKAMKERTQAGKVTPRSREEGRTRLIQSECFRVERLSLRGRDDWFLSEADDLRTASSVAIVVGLDGCGVLERKGLESVMFGRGDAVVVPAAMGEFSVRPQWEAEFLVMTIPPAEAANERPGRA